MNERQVKRRGDRRSLLLAAAMLGIVLVAAGSVVCAASATPVAVKPMTMLDPFALSTVIVSNPQPSTKVTALSVASFGPGRRIVIWIPMRPPVRSAFRPVP